MNEASGSMRVCVQKKMITVFTKEIREVGRKAEVKMHGLLGTKV